MSTTPPDSAPSPALPDPGTPKATRLNMIEPPERGDRRARPWVAAGGLLYVVLGAVFIGSQLAQGHGQSIGALFGLGDPPNPSVFVLVVGGVLLTLAAIRTVLRDLAQITAEEDDVQWVLEKGPRGGTLLVLARNADREGMFRAGKLSMPPIDTVRVETLIDDRVRRAYVARLSGRGVGVAVDELRIIAERRTARLGAFARYASSLLLLLAVLGTFAGVKTALPGLIEAVTMASETSTTDTPRSTGPRQPAANAAGSGGVVPESAGVAAPTGTGEAVTSGRVSSTPDAATIAEPLQAVSDAFGGNALALIGAIALGLMAHGIGTGRRHLLERLELASAEYVYGEERAQTTDPLQAAVQALRDTAREIQQSSGAFLGIESGLTSLGQDFKRSFDTLDNRLSEILNHQESGLYERTSRALDELRTNMAEMALAVRGNSQVYSGLVDRIGERSEEARTATLEVQRANQLLGTALENVSRLGDVASRSSTEIEASTRLLAGSVGQISERVQALTQALEQTHPYFTRVDESLQKSVARVEKADERAADIWSRTGEQIHRQLQGIGPQLAEAVARGAAKPGGGVWGAPAQPQATQVTPLMLVALPMGGVVGGVGLLYLLVRLGVLSVGG